MPYPVLTGLMWRPLFSYLDCDVPIEFELYAPQRPWTYRSTANGGHDVATSGVDESFVIRHDRIYVLHLRVTEDEWVLYVEPMLRTLWAQAQAFTVQLDANEPGTAHEVRLVAPWMDDGAQPETSDLDGMLHLDITVRTEDGSIFSYPYFSSLLDDEEES